MIGSQELPDPALFRTDGHLPQAVHVYSHEGGTPIGAVARFAPGTLDREKKNFRAFRYECGRWQVGLNGTSLPLYNLPVIADAVRSRRTVYVVEGEGCVDLLSRFGLPAATNPFGAGKWEPRFATHFAGTDVVLLPDNDQSGRKHMEQIAASLHGVARSVRVLELPGLGAAGDVVDWERSGGTALTLVELGEKAPLWTPPAFVHDGWEEPMTIGASEEAEPFPVDDGLPPLLRELSLQVAETIKVDPTAPATLAAVAVSASAGNVYRVRVSEAHIESNLARFAAWAAPSGERKTSTFAAIVRPFDNWMRDEDPAYRKLRSAAQAAASFYRRKAEYAETKGAKVDDPQVAAAWLRRRGRLEI